MKNYQAIIFDLDGTLINTIEDIADSMNRVLVLNGYPTYGYGDYKLMIGEGLKNLMERCLPESERNEANITRCLSQMMKEYNLHYVEKSQLYSGIAELLNHLSNSKFKLSILSNKADELTQKICRKLLSNWHFEFILGHSERFPRKPDPASALYIAQGMGVQPENILYLGDSATDMKTANSAGMFSVGAAWGFRGREELASNGAKLIIDEPEELIKIL